jgi:beta-phosphoglucomutase family hydrolase
VNRYAFVFDMDGVIVDSTPAHTEAWRRYLKGHGIELDDLSSRMLGKHNDEIVRDFFCGRELSDEEIVSHGARKEALYREMMDPELLERLVPGIHAFLESNRDVPKALATNAEPANVSFVLERAGIDSYFQAIVTGREVKRPKPSPDVYARAAELLRMEPADCIVFEDSFTGVQAARRAGMRVIGLTTTCDRFDDVDLTIRDFMDPELSRWLDQAATRT